MKLKLKNREAFIVYQALHARLVMLKTTRQHNGKLATRIQTTEALLKRLFPAPVVTHEEEEV